MSHYKLLFHQILSFNHSPPTPQKRTKEKKGENNLGQYLKMLNIAEGLKKHRVNIIITLFYWKNLIGFHRQTAHPWFIIFSMCQIIFGVLLDYLSFNCQTNYICAKKIFQPPWARDIDFGDRILCHPKMELRV